MTPFPLGSSHIGIGNFRKHAVAVVRKLPTTICYSKMFISVAIIIVIPKWRLLVTKRGKLLAAHVTCYNELFNKSEQSTEQTIRSLLDEEVYKAVNSKCLPKHLRISILHSWKRKFPQLDIVEYLNSEICGLSNICI